MEMKIDGGREKERERERILLVPPADMLSVKYNIYSHNIDT